MKRFYLFFIFLLFFVNSCLAKEQKTEDYKTFKKFFSSDFFQETLKMTDKQNNESYETYKKIEEKNKNIIKIIKKELKSDKLFIKYLDTNQSQWERYRDAMIKNLYPEIEDINSAYYGILYPLKENMYKIELTNNRINELKRLVKLRCLENADISDKKFCKDEYIENLFR